MAEYPLTSIDGDDLTVFITSQYYIIGTGETLDELQATGEWIATSNPVDMRP